MPDWYDLESLGYPYGPPTPDSRAGRIPGEITNSPSVMEQIGAFAQPIHEYGSMPAKAYVGEFNAAAQNLADFARSPNFGDLSAGLTRTAMVAGAPLTALGIGFGTAGLGSARDALVPSRAMAGSTEAQVRDMLKAKSRDEVRALQKEMGITADGIAGPGTVSAYMKREREREAALKNNAAVQSAIAEATEGKKQEGETKRLEAELAAKQAAKDAMTARIDASNKQLLDDLKASRTPPTDDSWMGQWQKKLGPSLLPLMVGAAAGGVARFAPKTGYHLIDDYLNPTLAGAEAGAASELAPLAATANRADPTNPDYRAWMQHYMRLPVEATDELDRVRSYMKENVPNIDPAVTSARERVDDPYARLGMMGRGAFAGLFGNKMAEGLIGAPATIARIPGQTTRAFKEGFNPPQPPPKVPLADRMESGAAVPGRIYRSFVDGFKKEPPKKPRTPKKPTDSPLKDAADKVQGMNGPKTYAQATQKQKDDAFNMLVQEVSASGRGKVTTTASIPEITKKIRSETGLPITEKRVRETLKMLGEHLGMTGSLRDSSAKRTAQTLGIGGAFAAPAAYSLDEDY